MYSTDERNYAECIYVTPLCPIKYVKGLPAHRHPLPSLQLLSSAPLSSPPTPECLQPSAAISCPLYVAAPLRPCSALQLGYQNPGPCPPLQLCICNTIRLLPLSRGQTTMIQQHAPFAQGAGKGAPRLWRATRLCFHKPEDSSVRNQWTVNPECGWHASLFSTKHISNAAYLNSRFNAASFSPGSLDVRAMGMTEMPPGAQLSAV